MVNGEKRNFLTMVGNKFREGERKFALFKCECGNIKKIRVDSVESGRTKSCGCKAKQLISINTHKCKVVHGDAGNRARLYNIYQKMKTRCCNPNYPETQYYRERGIDVCEEWLNDYITFRDWALSHGYADNLSIDRIDVNKGYSPDNCRWASSREQNRNKRNNVKITHDGKTMVLAAWCEELGLNYSTIEMRICRGWNPKRAITEPIQNLNKGKEGI